MNKVQWEWGEVATLTFGKRGKSDSGKIQKSSMIGRGNVGHRTLGTQQYDTQAIGKSDVWNVEYFRERHWEIQKREYKDTRAWVQGFQLASKTL